MYAHFNVRLLRKVRAVDYNSEYFAWEVEEVEAESEVEEDLVVPSPPQPLGRLRLIINGLNNRDKCNTVTTMSRSLPLQQ